MFSPSDGTASGGGVSAITVTASVTALARNVTFCSAVPPSGTAVLAVTVANDVSSNVTA